MSEDRAVVFVVDDDALLAGKRWSGPRAAINWAGTSPGRLASL